MTHSEQDAYFWKRLLFSAVPLILLLAVFARWVLLDAPENMEALLAAALSVFLFSLIIVRLIPGLMLAWSGAPELDVHAHDGKRSNRRHTLHPFFKIVFALIGFRLLLFAIAYLIFLAKNGYAGGIFDLIGIWNDSASDSVRYLYLAEHGYVAEGETQYFLVLLPLYPFLVRAANYIFENYLVSGLFISNLCAVFAGYFLYELALIDADKASAKRALKFLCLLPAAFLFSAPLSDSLLLMLSAAAMLLARRKCYPAACVVGFFAAFTQLSGILLILPIAVELIADIVRDRQDGNEGSQFVLACVVNVAALLLIPLGFGLYCYVNYHISGDAFRFAAYQQTYWQQSPVHFFQTVAWQVNELLSAAADGQRSLLLGLWTPNLLFAFGSLVCVLVAAPRLRSSYTLYFLAYFSLVLGMTRQFSVPRYLTAAFPLAISLGQITRKKWLNVLLTLLFSIGLLLYLYAFVMRWNVY